VLFEAFRLDMRLQPLRDVDNSLTTPENRDRLGREHAGQRSLSPEGALFQETV
jgi:hypothetical protein